MAGKDDMDFSYSTIDRFFRMSLGETGDFSGAWYDGDFSLTLEQAQRAKHERVASFLYIGKGSRVLDMSCGWGPFLNYVREVGASGVGVTLSSGRLDYIERSNSGSGGTGRSARARRFYLPHSFLTT